MPGIVFNKRDARRISKTVRMVEGEGWNLGRRGYSRSASDFPWFQIAFAPDVISRDTVRIYGGSIWLGRDVPIAIVDTEFTVDMDYTKIVAEYTYSTKAFGIFNRGNDSVIPTGTVYKRILCIVRFEPITPDSASEFWITDLSIRHLGDIFLPANYGDAAI